MKGLKTFSIAMAAGIMTAASAIAAVPDGYYDSLEGLSSVKLKQAVKALAREHTVVEYGSDTWKVFANSDVYDDDGYPVWWDMYSSTPVQVINGYDGLNIEHCVPNSWWGKLKNDAYKDLFHLNPSDATANGQKSNYPPGKVADASTYNNGVLAVGTPVAGQGGGAAKVYEPADCYKGDFARAYFYIFTLYDGMTWLPEYAWAYDPSSDLLLKPWAYELLLEWAKADPVSQKEMDRNEEIYKVQGNRNPFIDNPELAEHIWGNSNSQGFHYAGAYTPGPEPKYPIDPVNVDAPLDGTWYAVLSDADLSEDLSYVIADVKQNKVMSSTLNGKYMEVCANVAIGAGVEHPRITKVPSDAAVIKLVEVAGGYALGVSDGEGNFKGYLKATTDKSISLTQNSSDNGCTVTITPGLGETVISFGSAGKLQYNSGNPRFVPYNSNQNVIRLYRLGEDDEYPDDVEEPEDPNAGVGSLDGSEAPVLIGIYDVNGRRLNATGLEGLESGIYLVVTNYGVKKILK